MKVKETIFGRDICEIEVEMSQTDFLLEECYIGASNRENDSQVFKTLLCELSLILQHKLALGRHPIKGLRGMFSEFLKVVLCKLPVNFNSFS